jgi:large subunit ribosomal protein L13
MATFFPTNEEAAKARKWIVIDAAGLTLGRLASEAAALILGKHKVTRAPHMDCGDRVCIINAAKVRLTGSKLQKKIYYKHTGHVGHLKATTAEDMRNNKPAYMVELAVKGMLPKEVLGQRLMKNLRVYADASHDLSGQKPEQYTPRYARVAS